ncbi:Cytochrome c [Planctomycetes bacterium Pan216]|uniref:Cytochrome c n=1 Tax=Kolteria novifilia TaxID=2527975 RepID=A0A518AZH7_9BACT|nr:Cytochrome c [Planctomycetes bacterium Pan216]
MGGDGGCRFGIFASTSLRLVTSLVVLSTALVARAEFPPIVNSQPPGEGPISPEEAVKKIALPDGFNATLFAGEPDVQQPIAMTFDDRGRLWVAECYTYGGGPFDTSMRDRIIILDDQDNDGRFDKRTVFWDEGEKLTGLVLGFGGVWILNNGRLQFLPDKDANDIPDGPPVTLLDGFNAKEVGHNIVNGLMWGPDGWLYARHGIQATSFPGPPGLPKEERLKLNCGIWRFHPREHTLEVVARGTTNPWGMDYNDVGEFFFTNNVIGHLWHVIPGAHFRRMYGEDFNPYLYELIDQHADHYHWDTGQAWNKSRDASGKHGELGGGHSHCGGMIYLGDNWPEEYRNAIFMCNTHGRRINQNKLERHGSGYVGRRAPDMFFANQPWFRGVSLKYGPDGGVYVSDWVDLGECHDHDGVHRTSGRVYKVTYGTPETPPADLDVGRLSNDELAKLQRHPNAWHARHARRVLQERADAGQDLSSVHREMRELFKSASTDPQRLRALWTLYVTGGADHDWLIEQLDDPSEHVRSWAVRLLVDRLPVSPAAIDKFATMAGSDPSGLVRLYLASALRRLPLEERWAIAEGLASHSEDAKDHNMPLMIWYGIEAAVPADPKRALGLAASTPIPTLRKLIARRLTGRLKEDPASVDALVRLIAEQESAGSQQRMLLGMVDALRGWRTAPAPASWSKVQEQLAKSDDPGVRDGVRELSVVFGDGRALDALRKIAKNTKETPDARREALRILIDSRPKDLVPLLLAMMNDRIMAQTAVRGLASYDDPRIGKELVNKYRRLRHGAKEEAVNTLVSRPVYALALLDAIEAEKIPRQDIAAFHVRQLASFDDPKLKERLQDVWGIVERTPEEKLKLIEEHKRLLTSERLAQADLSHGRLLFKKTCATCHKMYGDGGAIGPDITGSNRHNLDYLLENILNPSGVVPNQYRTSVVVLADGRLVTGMLGRGDGDVVTIQTATEKIAIPADEIDEKHPSKLSLMPDGLFEKLNEEDIRDLIGYLSSRAQVPLPEGEAEAAK